MVRVAKPKKKTGKKRTGIEQLGVGTDDKLLGLNEDVFVKMPKRRGEAKRKTQEVMTLDLPKRVEDPEVAEVDDWQFSTRGWRKEEDFYGGDSFDDKDSDEEDAMREAKKLEALRAKRLSAEADPLAALLSHRAPAESPKDQAPKTEGEAAGGTASFDSLFGASVEAASVQKDIKQLSDTKRKGMVQSEAPELVPLLTDFQAKLKDLQSLLPLLSPQAHERMEPDGVEYLRAKAGLLLNTLANLSYYVMLRAEGGAVRSHPVLSQLVWLRELHEEFAKVDKDVAPSVKSAKKAWGKMEKELASAPVSQSNGAKHVEEPEPKAEEVPAKLSLRERFRIEKERREAIAAATQIPEQPQLMEMSTAALFKMPSKKGRSDLGAADVAADLDENDPLLGRWQPKTGVLADQLTQVQQQLGQVAKSKKLASADVLVEPQTAKKVRPVVSQPMEEEEDLDEKKAKAIEDREAKTAKRKAQELAKQQALAAQQFKPEEIAEGRRATTKRILANRGLTRQRKKYSGNARVSNRKKYEKALVRHKGAVQSMREGAADGTYEGEATGVRKNLKKSTTL